MIKKDKFSRVDVVLPPLFLVPLVYNCYNIKYTYVLTFTLCRQDDMNLRSATDKHDAPVCGAAPSYRAPLHTMNSINSVHGQNLRIIYVHFV